MSDIKRRKRRKETFPDVKPRDLRPRSNSAISSVQWKWAETGGREWAAVPNNQLFVMEIQQKDVWAGGKTTSLSGYLKKKTTQTGVSLNRHRRHRNCAHETSREHRQNHRREKEKKKVSSVSQSVSQHYPGTLHIKQLMCTYSIVLSSAGCYREEKNTTPFLKEKYTR